MPRRRSTTSATARRRTPATTDPDAENHRPARSPVRTPGGSWGQGPPIHPTFVRARLVRRVGAVVAAVARTLADAVRGDGPAGRAPRVSGRPAVGQARRPDRAGRRGQQGAEAA